MLTRDGMIGVLDRKKKGDGAGQGMTKDAVVCVIDRSRSNWRRGVIPTTAAVWERVPGKPARSAEVCVGICSRMYICIYLG